MAGLECKHTVRVVTIEGQPWFVAADVFRVLGAYIRPDGKVSVYTGLRGAVSADEKGDVKIITPKGAHNVIAVTESGLYKLIMRSEKPVARPFQDWVTREVLPSIRKTGSYTLGGLTILQ